MTGSERPNYIIKPAAGSLVGPLPTIPDTETAKRVVQNILNNSGARKEKTMAEYEMTAFRHDKEDPVKTMWFGSRPSDEWVYRLADEAELGEFKVKTFDQKGNVILEFDNGYIGVRKHIGPSTGIPLLKKRTK